MKNPIRPIPQFRWHVAALAVAAVCGCLVGPESRAGLLVQDILTGGEPMGWNNRTVGYDFSVWSPQPIIINWLGIWDEGGNGLAESHNIGIWVQRSPSDIRLEYSTVFPAGAGGTLSVDNFRFISIPPLALDPGVWCFFGAYYATGADPVLRNVTSARMSGVLSFGGARVSQTDGWGIPNQQVGEYDIGLFGPNLAYGALPEPGISMTAAAVGLLLLAAVRRCSPRPSS